MSEYALQKIDGTDIRPETAPMRFGDDWPGVFIRGDSALLGYGPAVRQALEALDDEKHYLIKKRLHGLAELLQSCHARNFS